MSQTKYQGQISVKALVLSLVIHLVLLGSFLFLKLANPVEKTASAFASASIATSDNSVLENNIYSKPKVVRKSDHSHKAESVKFPELKSDFKRQAEDSQALISKSNLDDIIPVGDSYLHEVEFYGNRASGMRICFVVDASGSMQGNFRWVKLNLTRSIENFEQDQFFNIIFYCNNKIVQFPEGDYLRASNKNKAKAVNFINSIRPGGSTNALSALYCAFKVSSKSSSQPIIFFLTDGFELSKTDTDNFLGQIANFKKNLAPSVKINTIGFSDDKLSLSVLEEIAQITGGNFLKSGFEDSLTN